MPNVSILIVSWDGYSDLWQPFVHCFFKYWPDCPYDVYLGCGRKRSELNRVRQIFVGDDVDYSTNILTMLREIDTPWVVLWTDDFFPDKPVATDRIRRLVSAVEERNLAYLDLLDFPLRISSLFAKRTAIENVREMPAGAPYRTSLGVTLWRKDFLQRFLTPGHSAWDIERKGTMKASTSDESFFCVHAGKSGPPISIVNMVEKRAWTQRGVRLLKQEHLDGVLANRPVQSRTHDLKMKIYGRVRYAGVSACMKLLGRDATARLLTPLVSSKFLAVQN